jgi:hypothetical protein
MNQNPSLIQRFLSDTPDFFKVLQLIGLLAVLANAVLVHYNISGVFVDDLRTAGFAVAFLSQFAVKEIPKVEGASNFATGLIAAAPDIIGAVDSLKGALADHSGTITSALGDVLTGIKSLSAAPAASADATGPAVQVNVGAAPVAPADVIDTSTAPKVEVKS